MTRRIRWLFDLLDWWSLLLTRLWVNENLNIVGFSLYAPFSKAFLFS
ncbi:MAG: hypothetical protein AAGM36_07840 [Cyanobacteria bacterium J06597_1]